MNGLKIGADVSSSSNVPFLPNKEKPIQIGFLKEVKVETKNKKGEDSLRIVFIFTDKTKKKVLNHAEFAVEYNATHRDRDIAGLQQRIKHIFVAFTGDSDYVLGSKAKFKKINEDKQLEEIEAVNAENFKSFFEALVEDFNTYNEGKPCYKTSDDKEIPVWLLITYYKNNPGLPLYPNFIEKYVEGKEASEITVNLNVHTLTQSEENRKSKKGGSISDDMIPSGDDIPAIP